MAETVIVYFDYLCPFAWRGAEVALTVAEALELRFDWRHFSLYQSNHDRSRQDRNGADGSPRGDADGWQLWNERIDPDDPMGCKGLLPFLASCAARRQGEVPYDAFRLELLRARHAERRPLSLDTIREVAGCAGLHLPRFESDLADPEARTRLAQDHHRAIALDVFGTPTFHFDGGHLAYFRIRELPRDEDEALRLFCDYRAVLERYPYLETVKRPRARGN